MDVIFTSFSSLYHSPLALRMFQTRPRLTPISALYDISSCSVNPWPLRLWEMTPAGARMFPHDIGRFQADVLIYSGLYSLYYKYRLVAIVGTSLVFSSILRITVLLTPSQLLPSLAVKASSNLEWPTDYLLWPTGTPLLTLSHYVPAGTWQWALKTFVSH